jgi:hypothetical protein
MLKAWLKSNGKSLDGFGLTKQDVLSTIDGYDNVSFTSNGTLYNYSRKDIMSLLSSECADCTRLKAENYILRQKLKNQKKYDVKDLIRTFIDTNYVKTNYRNYSRKLLYSEVDAFLRQYHIALTTALKNYISDDILKDKNSYRKFHVERIHK